MGKGDAVGRLTRERAVGGVVNQLTGGRTDGWKGEGGVGGGGGWLVCWLVA